MSKSPFKLLRQFIAAPFKTGSIAPSSEWLASEMTKDILEGDPKLVVEVGPGTGPMTVRLLKKKKPQTRFFAIELNSELVVSLSHQFKDLELYNDDAKNIAKYTGGATIDLLVVSLPWTLMPLDISKPLMQTFAKNLTPGTGKMVTFFYANTLPYLHYKGIMQALRSQFKSVHIRKLVLANLPPAIVVECK